MAFSGKYDFQGIKKWGAAGLKAAFPVLGRVPLISDLLSEFLANWLANNGLILLNIGAFYVEGELDQKALDKALDAGIKAVEAPGVVLTAQQMKEIDDAVIKAADKALPYGKPPKPS
jgi:hypothetical protein